MCTVGFLSIFGNESAARLPERAATDKPWIFQSFYHVVKSRPHCCNFEYVVLIFAGAAACPARKDTPCIDGTLPRWYHTTLRPVFAALSSRSKQQRNIRELHGGGAPSSVPLAHSHHSRSLARRPNRAGVLNNEWAMSACASLTPCARAPAVSCRSAPRLLLLLHRRVPDRCTCRNRSTSPPRVLFSDFSSPRKPSFPPCCTTHIHAIPMSAVFSSLLLWTRLTLGKREES